MTANERRRELLYTLSARRQDQVKNLAKDFNVSIATIYRDIMALSLEYPVYTLQGNKGGVFVMDGFYASNSYLTKDQEQTLLSVKENVNEKDKKIIESVIEKYSMPKVRRSNEA